MHRKFHSCRVDDGDDRTQDSPHSCVSESGELLSIVSIGDVVKARINEIENERKALADYVNS